MKNLNDIVFIVTARLNSSRVPKKMIKKFCDTTLLDICLEKLTKSSIIPQNNIYVSVFEKELIDIASKYKVNIYHRSETSANAESSLKEIYEWYNKLPFKYVILINACQPFLSIDTIDKFVNYYVNSHYDGLFGVIKRKNYYWNKNKIMITPWPEDQTILNTKAVEITYEAAHSLYASTMDKIYEDQFMGTFQSETDPELFEMEEFEVFDIDYEWQFQMAKSYYEVLYK